MLLLLRRLKALRSLYGDTDPPHVCGGRGRAKRCCKRSRSRPVLGRSSFRALVLAVSDGRCVRVVGSFDEDNRGGLPFGVDVPNDALVGYPRPSTFAVSS